jgi:hypothetical protein
MTKSVLRSVSVSLGWLGEKSTAVKECTVLAWAFGFWITSLGRLGEASTGEGVHGPRFLDDNDKTYRALFHMSP